MCVSLCDSSISGVVKTTAALTPQWRGPHRARDYTLTSLGCSCWSKIKKASSKSVSKGKDAAEGGAVVATRHFVKRVLSVCIHFTFTATLPGEDKATIPVTDTEFNQTGNPQSFCTGVSVHHPALIQNTGPLIDMSDIRPGTSKCILKAWTRGAEDLARLLCVFRLQRYTFSMFSFFFFFGLFLCRSVEQVCGRTSSDSNSCSAYY